VTAPTVDPAVYAQALADIRALRPYGTYQAPAGKLPPVHRPQCGTERGYVLHSVHGEAPHPACRDIAMAAQRKRRAAGGAS